MTSMMNPSVLFSVTLGVHVAMGLVALVAGFGAALAAKRRGWHTRLGQTYVAAMFGVAATAVPVTYLRPNPFLFLVALFSFQMTYSGWRTARLKGRPGTGVDRVMAALSLLWSACFVAFGARQVLGRGDTFGIVAVAFGGIGISLAAGDWKRFREGTSGGKPWILAHIKMMGGALIATCTAALVVNAGRVLPGVPATVVWLLPTMVGSPLIGYAVAKRTPRSKSA